MSDSAYMSRAVITDPVPGGATIRLNNAGEFALPPSRVEAMYTPEMFGEARMQRSGLRERSDGLLWDGRSCPSAVAGE